MADYIVKDTELTSVANSIRTAGVTSSLLTFPNGFISAINNISTYTKIVKTGTIANIITELVGNNVDILSEKLLSGEAVLNITATLGQDTANFVCYRSLAGAGISGSLTYLSLSGGVTYYANWDNRGALVWFNDLRYSADNSTYTSTNYLPMASAVNCTAELIYLGRID